MVGQGLHRVDQRRRARPHFVGHYQPQLPADLGFYDLRLPEYAAAGPVGSRYGIHGFCFHYYWFDGRRVLERPLTQMLESGSRIFPSASAGPTRTGPAAGTGTRTTSCCDRSTRRTRTNASSARARILKDPRYIRVGGAPLLLVYRVNLLPDAARTARHWRSVCAREGLP